MTMHVSRILLGLTAAFLSACASMGGMQDRFAVCSYDHAWAAALEAVKDRSITRQDRDKGVIETAWLEIPMPGRTYGALQRDIQGSKDRSRLTLTVKRLDDVVKVSYIEERQRWAFRGGNRLFGWADTDPSQDVMLDIQNRLDTKLKEQGCSLT